MRFPRLTSSFASSLALLLLCACPAGDDTAETGADASTSADGETTSADASGTDAADTDAETDADTESADETGNGLSGEDVFLSLCAPCHGTEGEGTTLGYELRHPVRVYSTWVVRNGRPGDEFPGSSMTAYGTGTVSDAQLEEIWDYLDAFPQPTTGEGLYLDYCRNCHGEDATGGVTGVNISDKEYGDILEKVRDGENQGDPGARMLYMPAFDSSWLTDEEIQRIADHIASL